MKAQERDESILEICRGVECSAKGYKDGDVDVRHCGLRRLAMRGDAADAVAGLASKPPDQLARLCLNSKPV